MSDGRINFDAMIGDTIRAEVYVGSQSHIRRIRVRFAHEIEGSRNGTAHIETTGEVLDYQAGPAGRSNRAIMLIDTNAVPVPGEYRLESLEVLTAGNRWLTVTDHPPIYLQINAEPEDDTPTYEVINFYNHP